MTLNVYGDHLQVYVFSPAQTPGCVSGLQITRFGQETVHASFADIPLCIPWSTDVEMCGVSHPTALFLNAMGANPDPYASAVMAYRMVYKAEPSSEDINAFLSETSQELFERFGK